jgi:hypothetical protein
MNFGIGGKEKMCIVFNRFSKLRSLKAKERDAKRANALKLLKAIHEIDDKYIAESILSSDLKGCYGKEVPNSEKESIERIKELTYKKIRALEKQNE